MTKRKKILLIAGSSVLGFVVLLVVAALIVIQTNWFANFVRQKVVAAVEDSTGGRAEIGSFQLDLSHLTVRIRDFVLHGKEPASEQPLARVALLELRLKLFSGLTKVVDLRYLGIQNPRVNLIYLPDGTTNIPQPKTPSKPSNTSGLQTVVNLAVNRFELNDGLIKVLDQKASLSAHGDNLRVLLTYNSLHPSYQGNLSINPLIVASSTRPPLRADVDVPIALEPDAIRVAGAAIKTARSHIDLSASVENLKTPQIRAKLQAVVSLPELQQSLEVPFDATGPGTPQTLAADVAVSMQQATRSLAIQTLHVSLGQTTLDSSGQLAPGAASAANFHANFALAELARLFKVSSVKVQGDLDASGRVALDAQNNYRVDGNLASRGLVLNSGTQEPLGVSLNSPFHADPYLLSMDGIRVAALGGVISAKVFIENMQNLSAEAALHNFSIPVLTTAATGKHLGYDGLLNGLVVAKGDLKAKGTTGYTASTKLTIVAGHHGVPLNGVLNANYNGARSTVDLGNSYIALPNTKLSLAGSLNREINIALVSRNLNDFLPAINFGSDHPETTLPLTLDPDGELTLNAQIVGNLSAPRIGADLNLDQFAAEGHSLDKLGAHLAASPSGAAISNGALQGTGISAAFDGFLALHDWKPLPRSEVRANLTMHQADLAALADLGGESQLQAQGIVNADVHVSGTYANPLGGAVLEVRNGSIEQQPFDRFYLKTDLADRLITLSAFDLDVAGGHVGAKGTFQHPRESFTSGHIQLQLGVTGVQLAQIQPLSRQNAGIAGAIQLSAMGAADIRPVNGTTEVVPDNVTADLTARGLKVQNQDAGELTAKVRTSNNKASYQLVSDFAGSNIRINGQTALVKSYQTVADLSIDGLSIQKALQIAGEGAIPATGDLSARAHVSGDMNAPVADLTFSLRHASAYQEKIDSLKGDLRYSNSSFEISSLNLRAPAGDIDVSGSFAHPANRYSTGAVRLNLRTSDIRLDKIQHVEDAKPGLNGIVRTNVDLSGDLSDRNGKSELLIRDLNAAASLASLRLNNTSFGGLTLNAKTAGSKLSFQLDSNLAQSTIHGQGDATLSGSYPVSAKLTFDNVRYSNLAPLLEAQNTGPVPYEALVDGTLSLQGPALDPDNLGGLLELTRLDLHTNATASPTGAPALRTVSLQNKEPIRIALNHDIVQIQNLQIAGRDTFINASGSVNLKSATQPLDLHVNANIDMGLLQDFSRDFYSSGAITMDAGLHGTFAQPRALGEIDLKNANINYSEAPVGLSNANGVILLNGTNASIQDLTAESGGGKIAVGGFFGLGAGTPNFNLNASANRVRVRYSGVSVTSNAKITLAGNVKRSLLSGTVSIQRLAYASSSDAGSLLSTASTPPSTPSSPSPLLSGMRLAVNIVTAPDIQVVSTYANRLSVIANLNLRGTAENPGMLGRVTVTDGQLVFFGNTYTVTTGTINFYDPNAISPVLNVSLETIAQGVDVTIGVLGPMNDLKLSYRSDPPLTFEQIVQLLATNTTPANPVIAAHQPTPPQQSLSQMGESAVLGQAVANPLANRVQRVFGLTQFKIDPSFAGSNGQPSARVTLQEKITSNLTFTYITDVTQTNSQIVRVQLDLTNNLSAVALRDYNGNVSLEMFYKFTRR